MLSISDATVRDWLGRIRDGGPDTAHVRCFPPPPAASYDRVDRVDRRFGEACALGRLSSRTYRTSADVGGYPFSVTAGETRLRRFADKRVNRGVARLFERVAGVTVGIDLDARLHASTLSLARRASRICQGATLSPWDLHHGHVVCRDGVHFLFHTQEYPRQDGDDFPLHLGSVQQSAKNPLAFHREGWKWRNVIVTAGGIGVVNVVGEAPIELATDALYLDEACLGTPLVDLYYVSREMMPGRKAEERVFVIPRSRWRRRTSGSARPVDDGT